PDLRLLTNVPDKEKETMDFKTSKMSELDIFRLVYDRNTISRSNLGELAESISPSTLYRLLDQLVQKNYLLEEYDTAASNGRPPKLYRVNPRAAKAIGVFITWDSFGISVIDMGGEIYEKKIFPKELLSVPRDTIHALTTEIKRLQSAFSEITGIGVATFGPIIKDKGILSHGHHKPSELWDYVPVKDLLNAQTGLPVSVDNLVSALLLHELGTEPGLRQKRVAYFMIDLGIGSAFFAPGITRPNIDTTGQLAHMTIDINGDVCVCRRKGCLETFVSAESIVKKLVKNRIVPEASRDRNPYSLLGEAAAKNRRGLKNVLEEIAIALATAILNYTTMMLPDCVFIGGRTMHVFPLLFSRVEEIIHENTKDADFHKFFEINKAVYSEDSFLQGAANIMFRHSYNLFT
ncbi:MAG: ROK family protein, partial [Spirochaetaceae bacterium]|nr:ROK family protein [Spirochaetaceae bacterium]